MRKIMSFLMINSLILWDQDLKKLEKEIKINGFNQDINKSCKKYSSKHRGKCY
jgi:hypothetical protein